MGLAQTISAVHTIDKDRLVLAVGHCNSVVCTVSYTLFKFRSSLLLACSVLHRISYSTTALLVVQAGMYPESTKAALRVHSQALSKQVNTLLVANAYEQDDLPGEKANTTINNNRTLGVHSSIDIQALLSAHAP